MTGYICNITHSFLPFLYVLLQVRTDTFDNDGFSPPATPQPLFSAKAFGALTNITPTNTHRLPEMPVEVIRNIIHRESQDAALVVLDLHAAGTHHSAEDFLQAAENIAEGLQRYIYIYLFEENHYLPRI